MERKMTEYRCSFMNPKSKDNLRKRLRSFLGDPVKAGFGHANNVYMTSLHIGVSERTLRRILNGGQVSCKTCCHIMLKIRTAAK